MPTAAGLTSANCASCSAFDARALAPCGQPSAVCLAPLGCRKCGHKWLARFAEGGAKALVDGSLAPHSTPQRTEEALERLIVGERRLHPTWGPKKLRVVLERKHAIELPPAVSTLREILKRNGLIEARRRRPGAFEVKRGELTQAERPNHVWAADYKGWFYTQDKERCDPLEMVSESKILTDKSALSDSRHVIHNN